MAINKKLIHFKSKQKFNEELANGNILDTSIVFILDSKLIYTHGTFYDGSTIDISNFVIPITWANLKDLRDNSLLIPGVWYRITNYMTTTTLINTRSAGHQFDLLVLATSSNTLSEEAKAVRHSTNLLVTSITLLGIPFKFYFKEELVINDTTYFAFECPDSPGALALTLSNPPVIGDIVYIYIDNEISTEETYTVESVVLLESEYFINNNANVSAWKIWYCLDNDKKRFPWALSKQDKNIVIVMDGTAITAEYVGTYEYEGVTYHRWDTMLLDMNISFLTESDSPQAGDTIPYYGIIALEYIMECGFTINAFNEASDDEGYGVIYRMIDEYNNDVPYDFKNILFIRKIDSNGNISTTDGTDTFLYTFSFLFDSVIDASFNTCGHCVNNFILSYYPVLNNIVLVSNYSYTDIIYNNFNSCANITFVNPDIYNNIINNSGNLVITNKSDNLHIEGVWDETLEIPSNLIYFDVRIAYDSNHNLKIYCLDDLIDPSKYYTKTEVNDNYYTKTEVDNKYKIAMVSKGTSSTTFSLLPNTFYKWGTVSSLTLTLTNPSDTSIYNEYMFEFKSGNTPTVLSLPSTILWTSPPFIEANKTYQCSILNNIGVIIAV